MLLLSILAVESQEGRLGPLSRQIALRPAGRDGLDRQGFALGFRHAGRAQLPEMHGGGVGLGLLGHELFYRT